MLSKTRSVIAKTSNYHLTTLIISLTQMIFLGDRPSTLCAAGSNHTLASLRLSRHWRPPSPPCSYYEMLIVNTQYCVSRCPIRCVNGRCFEDGVCPCADNYQAIFVEESLVCAAECLPGCQSAGGFCAAPDLCLCNRKGYVFHAVARRCRKLYIFSDRCLGRCLYGTCTTNGECICAQGYAAQNTVLDQLCAPVCTQDCGRYGFCFLPNMCACRKKHYHYEYDAQCHKDYIHLEQ